MKKATRKAFAALLRSFADLTEAGHCNLSESQITELVAMVVNSNGAPDEINNDHATLMQVEAGLLSLRDEVRELKKTASDKKEIRLIPKV